MSARSPAREGAKMTSSIFVVASREHPAKRCCPFAAALAAATHAHARSDCFTLRGLGVNESAEIASRSDEVCKMEISGWVFSTRVPVRRSC